MYTPYRLRRVTYRESPDNGTSWIDGTGLGDAHEVFITNYSDTNGPGAWFECVGDYDNSGDLHVVWNEKRYATDPARQQAAWKHWDRTSGAISTIHLAYYDNPGIGGGRRLNAGLPSLGFGDGSTTCNGQSNLNYVYMTFVQFGGRHRNFVELHLAKSRRSAQLSGRAVPHVLTTSYMTNAPMVDYLSAAGNYGYDAPLYISQGRIVGLRLVPMARDLRFAWEEMPQQVLDVQKQKMRESLHSALIGWALSTGEGADYTDNLPEQCLHPVGHWYEIPNMLRNGTLARLLDENPAVQHLLFHNIDTLGASLDPTLLGLHIESGAAMTAEVIAREVEDRGGGLARIDGNVRLIEGMALPDERLEFELSYYNSNTMWIDVARLLTAFGLTRDDLRDEVKTTAAIRHMAGRMPTYVTLKDVKKRWGKGQEDIFPVMQFEKLWGDMTALPDLACSYAVVPRMRGQQLKDVAQLDGWLRHGSAAYVDSLCEW